MPSQPDGEMTDRHVLFVLTDTRFFLSHRLPVVRAARASGLRVALAAHGTEAARDELAAEGVAAFELPWWSRVNPFAMAAMVLRVRALIVRLRPDIVHAVALLPCLIAGLAALLAGRPRLVLGLTGLGFVFASNSLFARLLKPLTIGALRFVVRHGRVHLTVQNTDDRTVLERYRIAAPSQITLIAGSGVDTDLFAPPAALPTAPPVRIGFAARLIAIKGVEEFVAAGARLHAEGQPVSLHIAGTPDPNNPSVIPRARLNGWKALPFLTLHGKVADMAAFWGGMHIACMPSRGGEGLPKALLEAGACGLPLVATDSPGCRDLVIDGENGRLVPPRDVEALAEALRDLALDAARRAAFGKAARARIVACHGEAEVGAATLAIYGDLLGAGASQG